MSREWSNLAHVVYNRTYARSDSGTRERWPDTVERVIAGNVRGFDLPQSEIQDLRMLLTERKAGPAGRGLWFSGTRGQERLGGAALNNCWATTSEDPDNFVWAQDMLMLGGGVGMSVEHRFTSKLPRIRRDVIIEHRATRDADFIVPDSREGWCELLRRVLEAFFSSGRSFTYSTICIRGAGEPIAGFGGVASGPRALVQLVEKLCVLLHNREGRHVRPIDAADILTAIGEMVVAGNVRRSAIIILGDPWDKEFLRAKRWDLGGIPTQRAMANYTVVVDDVDDLHPLYWETFLAGEAFGIFNRRNVQRYGRMGEILKDSAYLCNPCGEATLEDREPCNLQNIALPNLAGPEEFKLAARLMHRWGKRVTMERYHDPRTTKVVARNRRVGTSLTGCQGAPNLFRPEILDCVYTTIREENIAYAAALGIPPSVRTTTINPGGTWSKVMDVDEEGLGPAWSRYMIQRVRFAATDPDVSRLLAAGHHGEPAIRFDGSQDLGTMVLDFPRAARSSSPCQDEGFDTWQQLDALLLAQRHWADQAVSTTVTYRREEIPRVREWLAAHLSEIKTVSFLAASDHGFLQAPKEAITAERYEELMKTITPLKDGPGGDTPLEGLECAGGACPIR